MFWPVYPFDELKTIVLNALEQNSSFYDHNILGLPATYLDPKMFPADADFLENAPFIRSFIENPNHIGLHTYEKSLPAFKGTQKIELDLLRICAENIFKATPNQYDGYIASGGTECNIQAVWIFREYYKNNCNAKNDEIGVLFSEDTHYSLFKVCNILQLNFKVLDVDFQNREINLEKLDNQLLKLKADGVKYFITVLNMATTMFGSIDDIDSITQIFNSHNLHFKIHVDAAFGGFIYPFTNPDNAFNFENPNVDSLSVDGHKMLQAPYGTGIFLIKKGLIDNVLTEEASYIEGLDHTLCGSRSGANAIATWMILNIHGSKGLMDHMKQLIKKTDFICKSLSELDIRFFRNEFMNIVTILSEDISSSICEKYTLVPDTHKGQPKWWKIVVMEHVNWELIYKFVDELARSKKENFKVTLAEDIWMGLNKKTSITTKERKGAKEQGKYISNFNRGKQLFNDGKIHEAYVIWEQIWKAGNEEARANVKGFIQLSGGVIKNKYGKKQSTEYLLEKAIKNIKRANKISEIMNTHLVIDQINEHLIKIRQGEGPRKDICISL